jgi:tetratricopeptide (TPR) repeat protein
VRPVLSMVVSLLALGSEPAPPDTSIPEVPSSIDFEQAALAAERIPNEIQRGKLLVEIAAVMARRGDHVASRALARRGLDLVRKVIDSLQDEGRKGYVWVQLALLQHCSGDREAARRSFDRAIEAARTVAQPNRRLDILQFIARSLAEVGDFEGAQRKTEIVTSSGLHIFALRDVAVAQARVGDLDGARSVAAKIRLMASREKGETKPGGRRNDQTPLEQYLAAFELARSGVLSEIALAQSSSGSTGNDPARKTIDQALDLIDRNMTLRPDLAGLPLAIIALAQAKVGDVAQSRRTFERALDVTRGLQDFPAAEIMAQIAGARWRAGETGEAQKILREAFTRCKSLHGGFPQVNDVITQTELEIGDLDGALETARASRDAEGHLILRPDVLRQVVRAQATASSPRAAAADWYSVTTSPVHRAYILLGSAEAAASLPVPEVQWQMKS